jgi:hypothetical protein
MVRPMARRRRSKWSKGERNRLEAPFAPFPCEMIESVAFRSLSGSAVKILLQLTTVWSRCGGITHNVNGNLVATYEQFRRFWGMDSHTIAAVLRELVALGFIERKQGAAGNADEREPNEYRLTFLPAEGVPGTGSHEWRRITASEDAERIATEARETTKNDARRVKRPKPPVSDGETDVTDVTDKFRIPGGIFPPFHGEKSPVEGVTAVTNVTAFPRWKIPRNYISRPVGLEEHNATTPGSTPPAPAPMAQAGPPLCEACGAEIQSRRIDARFCSGRCRLRAHRHASNSLMTLVAAALPRLVWTTPVVREVFGEEARARRMELDAPETAEVVR